MKPILFNTGMVRAILDGRKTVTRRVVKPQPPPTAHVAKIRYSWNWSWWEDSDSHQIKPPYHPGDVLYVREAFQQNYDSSFSYRAGHKFKKEGGWRPSIHMPREAARIFLRVTEVRVERLRDITEDGSFAEGAQTTATFQSTRDVFRDIWNSTIKPADRSLYGWEANPWVWVIAFERISKEEAMEHDV